MHTGPWDQHTQKPLPVLAWTNAPAHTGSVATELELSSAGTTHFPSQGSATFTFQTHWHLVYLEPVSEPTLGERWFTLGLPMFLRGLLPAADGCSQKSSPCVLCLRRDNEQKPSMAVFQFSERMVKASGEMRHAELSWNFREAKAGI